MPSNGLSLLPEEMRGKEKEAKEKAKKAMKTPKFDMHMPEKVSEGQSKTAPQKREEWVKFADNGAAEKKKKGVFKMTKKPEQKKVAPVAPPKPKPPVPPVPPVMPPKPKKEDLWSKYAQPVKGLFRKIKPEMLQTSSVKQDYIWFVKSECNYKKRAILFVIFILIVLLCASWLGLRYYQNDLLNEYNENAVKLNQINQQIERVNQEESRVDRIKSKAVLVNNLVGDHIYWTNLFALLEQNTLDNISYIEFQALSENEVMLTVLASDYTNLAKQVDVLDKANFTQSVDIDFARVGIDEETDEQEVQGEISLYLEPGILHK